MVAILSAGARAHCACSSTVDLAERTDGPASLKAQSEKPFAKEERELAVAMGCDTKNLTTNKHTDEWHHAIIGEVHADSDETATTDRLRSANGGESAFRMDRQKESERRRGTYIKCTTNDWLCLCEFSGFSIAA